MASIERRSGKRSDAYVVRFRDDGSRQRSKSFSTKVAAMKFANKVEVQMNEGDWIDPEKSRERFGDFHARWIRARSVSPSRTATEESQARNHILPFWGSKPLSRIRPLDVDIWLKELDVGATTRSMVLAQFKLCLSAAVREGLIRTNPAASARAPAVARKRVTMADVLDAHEIDLLVANTPDHWKALIFLSAWIGWRWSEAMGLRWSDVDLEVGVVYVGNQTVVESRGVQYVRDHGKTNAATRTVPLPGPALDVLRWHRDRSAVDPVGDRRVFLTEPCPPALKHAVTGRKGGCRFVGECPGHTPFRSNFRRIFVRAAADAGLEGRGVNMRQLRHTSATLMLSHGVDILDVQERLGHTRGSVTLDIYGRVLAGRRDASTALLGRVMGELADLTFVSDVNREDDGNGSVRAEAS